MQKRDVLNPAELRYLTTRDDNRAWTMLTANWLAIFAILYVAWVWTNPLTIIAAVALLGGRQLGLAVIMHECGHHTFFTGATTNRFVGQWLAARPVFSDLELFFNNHRTHHQSAGTSMDPDLPNYQSYPISRASFKRKITRDLTGQTGLKLLSSTIVAAKNILDPPRRESAKPYAGILVTQFALLGLFAALMNIWVYLIWFTALMTSYMLIIRIRQIAEHAAVPCLFDPDPRKHARTTIPTLVDRFFIAPNYVNYHLEHHFLPGVPCYKLRQLHELLKHKGYYDHTRIFRGYREVIENAIQDHNCVRTS